LAINSATGRITGTLSSSTSGLFFVTVTASDGSHSTSQSFSWMVEQVGVTSPGDQTNNEGDTVSLQVQASAASGTLSFTAGGLPPGLTMSSAGLISGTIPPGAAGTYAVTVAASNGSNSNSQTITWTVNPRVNLTTPADQANIEGDSISFQVSASESGATLTYSADGLPSGVTISSTTGLISGSIASGAALAGPYWVTVTVSDGTYSNSTGFYWLVKPAVAPAAPVVSNPGTQSNQTGDSVLLQVQASDTAGYTLNYSTTGLPNGLWIDPTTGLISGIVADDAASLTPYSVTVTVDDGVGETTSKTFLWQINASPITVQANPIQAVAGTDTGALTIGTFTTPDLNSQAGDFLATVTWGDGTSDQATVTGQNGSFVVTDNHTYEQTGSLPVSLTVTDQVTGGSASASTTASVAVASWTLTGALQEGVLAGTNNVVVVGTLQDSDPNITASNFSVQIDPGDGSPLAQGTVTAVGNGEWSVSFRHTYSTSGSYTPTMTATGQGERSPDCAVYPRRTCSRNSELSEAL
jgi:hypothetical protein